MDGMGIIFIVYLAINSTKNTFTQDFHPICTWPGPWVTKTVVNWLSPPPSFFCRDVAMNCASASFQQQPGVAWCRVVFKVKCLNSCYQLKTADWNMGGGGNFWVFFWVSLDVFRWEESTQPTHGGRAWGKGTNWTQNWWDENLDTSGTPKKMRTAWQKSKLTQNKGSIGSIEWWRYF